MHSTREDRPEKLARWRTRLDKERFIVPHDRGALWSGIGVETAKRLAQSLGLVTLEMTPLGRSLDGGPLKAELDRDFGGNWIAEKRLIFGVVSTNFVRSLHGRVTVLLPETFQRPRNGAAGSFAYNVKVIWDELREADFGDPRIVLHKISAMRVCRVRNGQIVSDVFMPSSPHLH